MMPYQFFMPLRPILIFVVSEPKKGRVRPDPEQGLILSICLNTCCVTMAKSGDEWRVSRWCSSAIGSSLRVFCL